MGMYGDSLHPNDWECRRYRCPRAYRLLHSHGDRGSARGEYRALVYAVAYWRERRISSKITYIHVHILHDLAELTIIMGIVEKVCIDTWLSPVFSKVLPTDQSNRG